MVRPPRCRSSSLVRCTPPWCRTARRVVVAVAVGAVPRLGGIRVGPGVRASVSPDHLTYSPTAAFAAPIWVRCTLVANHAWTSSSGAVLLAAGLSMITPRSAQSWARMSSRASARTLSSSLGGSDLFCSASATAFVSKAVSAAWVSAEYGWGSGMCRTGSCTRSKSLMIAGGTGDSAAAAGPRRRHGCDCEARGRHQANTATIRENLLFTWGLPRRFTPARPAWQAHHASHGESPNGPGCWSPRSWRGRYSRE